MFAGNGGELRVVYFLVVWRVQLLYARCGRRRVCALARERDLDRTACARDLDRGARLALEPARRVMRFLALVERGIWPDNKFGLAYMLHKM